MLNIISNLYEGIHFAFFTELSKLIGWCANILTIVNNNVIITYEYKGIKCQKLK